MIKIRRKIQTKEISEDLSRVFLMNKELCISFRKGVVSPGRYYRIEPCGKNIKLIPLAAAPWPGRNKPSNMRKIRVYNDRLPRITLPEVCTSANLLYRVIRCPDGTVWLLRIEEFLSYADEASFPPEIRRLV